MTEQKLEIIENGQYKNINLKTKPENKKTKKPMVPGIDKDNFIIVEKIYAEGYENPGNYGLSYSCKVIYLGEEVSFWLDEEEHDAYKEVGGVDDKVKITLTKEMLTNAKGRDYIKQILTFELVE